MTDKIGHGAERYQMQKSEAVKKTAREIFMEELYQSGEATEAVRLDGCVEAGPVSKITEAALRAMERLTAPEMLEDWVPLAKALFKIERNPKIKDQAWFDFQSKAQLIVRAMQNET